MRVGNVKEIVFSKDPKQMNWLREEFPYAEVKCPPEFSAEVQNEKDGDVLTTKIVVSYNGAHPYFTNAGSIGVSFPLQDRYTGSVTCRDYRCHAHVFCGENTSYIMALRMGGAASGFRSHCRSAHALYYGAPHGWCGSASGNGAHKRQSFCLQY